MLTADYRIFLGEGCTCDLKNIENMLFKFVNIFKKFFKNSGMATLVNRRESWARYFLKGQ